MIPLSAADNLVWLAGHLIAGVVGVVVGLFIENALPDRLRLLLIYWSNRVKKWVRNDPYKIQVSSQYELEESQDIEEFDDELAREIGVRSDDHGKFCFDRETGSINADIEITPQYQSQAGLDGDIDVDQQQVSSVLINMSLKPRYRELTTSLIDLQDIERDLVESVVSLGGERQEAAVRCELPVKPTLQKLLGKGQIESLTGTSGQGDRITVSDEEMQIHSDPQSPMTATIKRAIVHYA